MAKTIKQLQPHKFSAGDTVKVVLAGRTEWCNIGDTHTIRICKHDHKGEPVYVVDFDKDDSWIRECNLELVGSDRQKCGEWKRHRGGKCPVPAGTKVSTRHRDGEIVDVHFQTAEYGTHKAVMDCVWKHDGSKNDIMAYKVISQPQAEEVEVKDTTIGTLSYKVEIDTSAATQAIDELAAKWDQVDGPLLWRDRIVELEAHAEHIQREISGLFAKLNSEGFQLIRQYPSLKNILPASLPFAEWKEGDIVTSKVDYNLQFTKGKNYTVAGTYVSLGENRVTVFSDDKGNTNGWLARNFLFHSRQ